MSNKKINLDKLTLDKESILTIKSVGKKRDHDTPTINDNCCGDMFTTFNTIAVCNPHDWCGYWHESNCLGPFLTKP